MVFVMHSPQFTVFPMCYWMSKITTNYINFGRRSMPASQGELIAWLPGHILALGSIPAEARNSEGQRGFLCNTVLETVRYVRAVLATTQKCELKLIKSNVLKGINYIPAI